MELVVFHGPNDRDRVAISAEDHMTFTSQMPSEHCYLQDVQ